MGIFPYPRMAREVQISLGERSYPIVIGAGALARLPETLRGRRGLVITDANVDVCHGGRVMDLLGGDWGKWVVAAGEMSKSAAVWADLLEKIAAARLDRQRCAGGAGRGRGGDLTGFAAAAYMRGIGFVQAPTSLLAMVDSSVGGKTGINLAAGKNLAGAFHQPLAVVADLDTLATLPAREFAAGMAEVVKYGVALDAAFLTGWAARGAIEARESAALEQLVARSCEIKADIVARDEREGLRAVLNFGHTLGTRLRKSRALAVCCMGRPCALGMVYALELAVELRALRLPMPGARALLRRLGLPVAPAKDWAWPELLAAMGLDKKWRGQVRMVLSEQLGHSDLPVAVPVAALTAAWERWCAHGFGG